MGDPHQQAGACAFDTGSDPFLRAIYRHFNRAVHVTGRDAGAPIQRTQQARDIERLYAIAPRLPHLDHAVTRSYSISSSQLNTGTGDLPRPAEVVHQGFY